MLKSFAFIILFFICLYTSAQSVLLKINIIDSTNATKNFPFKTTFVNSLSCVNYINQIPNLLKAKGYISCSIDSIIEQENVYTIHLFIGNLYVWKNLQLPTELNNVLLPINNIETLPETVLNYYENNGYPFAKISFDSVIINNKNEITAILKIDKGYEYKLNNISVFGNVNISNNFLEHLLKLPKNSLYSKEKFELINEKLSQLAYLSSYKNWDISMLNTGYNLTLYLQPQKVNKLNAIIGFLPNNNQKNGKLLLTLDANIYLQNAFAKGETISLNWQQIQPQSPKIDISFIMPYILKTNTELDCSFSLYKRDSAYLNITTNIGVAYYLSNKNKFKIGISNFSTRIIDADTNTIIATKKLPNILDMNINNLGVEYFYNNTIGNKNNKTQGFELKLFTSVGQKKIKPNNTITSLKNGGYNYNSLYDSINNNLYQIKTTIQAAKYFMLSKQSVLKLQANYGLIHTQNYLQNELFQIGGFKLLRGFDEENIYTNEYVVSCAEYRYLINKTSYFFVFNDMGFTKNKLNNKDYSYIGTGIGLALETKQGILNISFAAGKRNDLPFNLRETKIHIGIINNL